MAPPRPVRRKETAHLLDKIRVRIAPHVAGGFELLAYADYGPCVVPLLGEDVEIEKDGRFHIPERDLDVEGEARTFLSNAYPLIPGDEPHRYRVYAEDAYAFAKEILPEIEYRYTVDAPKEVLETLTVRSLTISPDMKVKAGRGGWFDFSIAWHAEQANVKTDALIEAVQSGKPYVKTDDGQLVELSNASELEQMVELLAHAKQNEDGSFTAQMLFAPEFVSMLERAKTARIEAMDRGFETFLKEVKSGKPVEPIAFPAELGTVLRPYQKDGVAWIMFLRKYGFGGILADEMGLGKTLEVLSFIAVTRKEGDMPDLVICPKTLALTWEEEARRYVPWLKVLVVDGLAEEREALIKTVSKYDLVITTYPSLQRDIRLYLAQPKPFRTCMLDEAQYIKNSATATAKACKLVPSDFRLALTGTPLENGVHELWSIFDYLMPDFLGSAKDFRVRFERPIRDRQDMQVLERLRLKVRPFMLRRTKANLLSDLPPKVEQVSHAALTAEQLVVYARTLEEVRAEVEKAVAEKGFKRARIEILTALMKLRRICDHPALADQRLPRTEELSGKMGLALELVRQASEGGKKVLLFSQFTGMLDILREALDVNGIGHVTIEGKTKDRQAQVKRFATDPKVAVFLLSLRAGGTGLTLTEADTVILFDPWWNPMVEAQAMDRAHRIGQTQTVNVYKLVTKGTVEEKVMDLQDRKRKLFDALVQETTEAMEDLTWEDVQGLFV
ncbi:SNF2 family helicase [Patescibacteria group bacterium]|jgi:SNF2 family DNA or RNA helicase|nr:SNF2 family helicase [Patescibacteria group bacterium]